MSLWDIFTPRASFKSGRLTRPTKFRMECRCGGYVVLSIPHGMAQPSVQLLCQSCSKCEVIGVVG